MKTIKLTYQGPLDRKLDDKLKKCMESIGAIWIGQGTEIATNKRDISFELDAEKVNAD